MEEWTFIHFFPLQTVKSIKKNVYRLESTSKVDKTIKTHCDMLECSRIFHNEKRTQRKRFI